MGDETLPRLLKAGEVADVLGVRPWRAYELMRSGDLPVVRIGKSVRVSVTALKEWIEGGGTKEEGE